MLIKEKINRITLFLLLIVLPLFYACKDEDSRTGELPQLNCQSFTDIRDGHKYQTNKFGNHSCMLRFSDYIKNAPYVLCVKD